MEIVSTIFDKYELTVHAMGAMALLMLIQISIADFFGIRARHPPGTPVAPDHGNPLFRATRALANTNENIAVYLLLVLFCIFSGASATWTASAAWVYVGGRVAHSVCYYLDLKTPRSLAFGVSLLALFVMLGVGAFS